MKDTRPRVREIGIIIEIAFTRLKSHLEECMPGLQAFSSLKNRMNAFVAGSFSSKVAETRHDLILALIQTLESSVLPQRTSRIE